MSPLLLTVSSVWLGVGLLALGAPGATRRPLEGGPKPSAPQLWRSAGVAALLLPAVPLSAELGYALALGACSLASMAAASLAVLLARLWPRFYLTSVCSSAALVVVAGFR